MKYLRLAAMHFHNNGQLSMLCHGVPFDKCTFEVCVISREELSSAKDNADEMLVLHARINTLANCNSGLADLAALEAQFREAAKTLAETAMALVEIGKRDLMNPKYDGYFEVLNDEARDILALHAKIEKRKGRE